MRLRTVAHDRSSSGGSQFIVVASTPGHAAIDRTSHSREKRSCVRRSEECRRGQQHIGHVALRERSLSRRDLHYHGSCRERLSRDGKAAECGVHGEQSRTARSCAVAPPEGWNNRVRDTCSTPRLFVHAAGNARHCRRERSGRVQCIELTVAAGRTASRTPGVRLNDSSATVRPSVRIGRSASGAGRDELWSTVPRLRTIIHIAGRTFSDAISQSLSRLHAVTCAAGLDASARCVMTRRARHRYPWATTLSAGLPPTTSISARGRKFSGSGSARRSLGATAFR